MTNDKDQISPVCAMRRLSLACASGTAAMLLSACSQMSMPSMPLPDLPDNTRDFRPRVYAGAAVGSSRLTPDTQDTIFDIASDSDTGSQMRLGYDLHNLLAVEFDTSVLGSAELVQGGTDVKYSAIGASALLYAGGNAASRSRREGWSAYGRLGYAYVKRASQVIPLDRSGAVPVFGIGAEYGMQNGLGIRAELTRMDEDATYAGLGAIYRFGLSAREFGSVFVDAARPVLAGRDDDIDEIDAGVNEQQAASEAVRQTGSRRTPPKTTTALAYATPIGARPLAATRSDRDADGIENKLDECPGTRAYTTVASNGCGLLDGILEGVEFKSGSYWLSPSSKAELDILAATLLAFPEVRVQVRAYTDSKGDEDLNLAVSRKRAGIVVDYLMRQGVNALQLSPQGLGEADPIADNDTTLGRARNRRIELLTLPNLTREALASVAAGTAGSPIMTAGQGAPAVRSPVRDRRAAPARAQAADRATVFPTLATQRIEPLPGTAYTGGFSSDGIIEGLRFDSGSADLSTKGKRLLDRLATELNDHPRVRVAVIAHTDDQGEESNNQRLSERRADSVVEYLVGQGVARERLRPEGYGSRLPLVQNVTDADRERNRRVEIRILP